MRSMSSMRTRFGSAGRIKIVAHFALGHFQRYRLASELVVRQQAVHGTFEVAALYAVTDLAINTRNRAGTSNPGCGGAFGGDPALEDFDPQFLSERADFDYKAAGEPRPYAVVEAFQISRRPVAGNHHLPAGVDSALSVWQNSACVERP